MAATYTGFKLSVAAAADHVKPTVAQTLTKHAELPLSPPSSAGSDVDAAEFEKRYTEDWNGQYRFAPIKEHIVSRGEFPTSSVIFASLTLMSETLPILQP